MLLGGYRGAEKETTGKKKRGQERGVLYFRTRIRLRIIEEKV